MAHEYEINKRSKNEINKRSEKIENVTFIAILLTSLVSLILLVVLINQSSIIFAKSSELGENCKLSGECRQGYCEGGICKFPTVLEKYTVIGVCNYTAQCIEGFCMENECILPTREEYDILTLGIKSGCAGVIENCTGIWCMFCNVIWVLLLIGSVFAAYTSRKRGRLLPIILFIVPVAFGIVLLPLLGFLMSLTELFMLAIIRRRII